MFSCIETNIIVVSGADICMHFKDQLTTSVSCEAKKKQNRNPYLFFYFLLFSIHIIISFYIMVKKRFWFEHILLNLFFKGIGHKFSNLFRPLNLFRFCAYAIKPYSLWVQWLSFNCSNNLFQQKCRYLKCVNNTKQSV